MNEIEQFTRIILTKIKEANSVVTEAMQSGGASDYASYQNLVGQGLTYGACFDIVNAEYNKFVQGKTGETEDDQT